MPHLVCLAVLWILAATPLWAKDIFVNNVAGDDLNAGTMETSETPYAGPVRTIAKALRMVDKGDRILLAKTETPYHESLSLSTGRQWGTITRPLTIVVNGAILDGSAEVPHLAWEHHRENVFRFRPPLLTHQQLYLDGRPAARKHFDRRTGAWPELEPLEWMLHDGHIYFRAEPGKLPADYPLRFTALQTGITLYHVRHVRIEDLVVQGFQLDGINVNDAVYECTLAGVLCRGNGRSGISIGGSSRAVVLDSRCGDNGEAQVRSEGFSLGRLERVEIVANTAPAFSVVGGRLLVDGQPVESDSPAPEPRE